MKTLELLSDLHRKDIKLWAEGDKLRYSAPPGMLTPTLRAELSQQKEELLRLLRGSDISQSPILPAARDRNLPLSFAQQRLWFLDQLEPGSPLYIISTALRLRGRLKVEALQQSLETIVARHEVLRTNFITIAGNPSQVIGSHPSVPLPVVDLSLLLERDCEAEAQRLATEEAQRPFDLAADLMLRAKLLRLREAEHILLLTVHHIAADGWSLGVLYRELSVLYEAFCEGKPATLPEPPLQYADFAVWQRRWLQGEVLERQLAYWKQQLQGAPPVLDLATDHPRSATQSYQGAQQTAYSSKTLAAALHRLSQQEGATLFMTLLAAFKVLLYRYTGQDDMVVGSPIANRNRAEMEGVIGFFVNSLALRTDLSGGPSFRQVLRRVRETTLGAYTHQDLPFEKLVEEIQPQRHLSHTPLFQVFFNMLNAGGQELELAGVKTERFAPAEIAAKFDLTLYVAEKNQELHFRLVYNNALFDATTIIQMLGHYKTLLEGIVANPDRAISRLPLLTETEKRQRSRQVNLVRPGKPFLEFGQQEIEQSIPARFEQQVNKYSDKLAVRTKKYEWTYEQLNRATNHIARTLLTVCGPGEGRVGLLFEHDAPMIAVMLGALKAGKTYVPLDPTYPPERLRYIVADSQPGAILTNSGNQALAERLVEDTCPLIVIDHLGLTAPIDNIKLSISADTPAYILYTSGSTGQPKGVMQNHRNVLHHIRVYTNNLQLGPEDKLTLLSSYGFDAAVMDIYSALLNGAALYPVSLKDEGIVGLGRWLTEQAITIYHSTPTVYRYFINSLAEDERFLAIRCVVLGGEEVFKRDVELYKKHFSPECIFVNGLGPTESTVSLQYFINQEMELSRNSVPVGYPVEGTEILLLDGAGEETEVYGEIGLRSPHLALGYWGQPALTQKSFLPDSAGGNSRIYRTGDMGRFRPDGVLEFAGRKDSQVKIRGFRIELGEIEAALGTHQAVRESVVLARENERSEKYLVAYVVPNQGVSLTVNELRHFLGEKLPGYMVPSAFVVLASLPRTAHGKLDRRALPVPDLAQSESETPFVAPRTPIEEIVARVWADLLRLERVGAADEFFAVGGHSLLATQVISRLRDAFQVELPLRTLFEASTVADLAKRIELARRTEPELEAPPLCSRAGQTALPLSFAQQRLWFLDQLEPNSPLYNLFRTVRLRGELKVDALQKALELLVNRHASLRTTFIANDGQPVQVIAEAGPVTLPIINLAHYLEADREVEVQRLLAEEAVRPFDLAADLMLRAKLVRLGGEEYILLLTVHHIAADGWSMGLLFRELSLLYGACCQDKPSPLPSLPIQYADFALWQRQWLQGQVLQRQLAYWKQQLDGAPAVLELPTDRPRPAVQTYHGARHTFLLSKTLTEALKQLSQQASVTLFMTLLAAFKVLLSRYSGQKEIVVGSPIANRNRTEIEGVIGFFVNSLALRTDLSGDPGFDEVLSRVREVTLGAYAHQDLPFEKLVEELQPQRDPGHSPLFQVLFALQNISSEALELPGVTVSRVATERMTAKFDLSLITYEREQRLTGAFEYNTDLFDAATIERMAGHFQTLLEGIVANPKQHLSALPILSGAERHQILAAWNDTKTDYPHAKCIQELFEAQVERTPKAVAVIFQDQQLSYEELNSRANQLAHHLRALGVGPETPVGICTERSLDMVIGLLGILKAGGAYLPLDPAYPSERLAFMMSDNQAPVLLTQSYLLDRLPEHKATVICLDTDWEQIAQESKANPVQWSSAENLAYVMYTSGSTGKPKGISIPHRAINRLVFNTNYINLQPDDRVALASNSAFDAATFELWGALLHGACLVGISKEVALSPLDLAVTIREQGVTTMFLTTALFNQLAREAPGTFQSIRHLLFGGEAVDPHWVKTVLEHEPPERLLHVYGPTESTTFTTWYLVEEVTEAAKTVPIGKPLSNTQAYVLDRALQPVPVGVAGELYIGGAGLARGYLNRPELTADRFVPDPFSNEPGTRLYRSGDLVRYLPSGTIEFLGRIDQQVKIRGFRIELGEIEAVLEQHPAVREALVLAREDRPGEKRLVAYVTLKDESSKPFAIGELRRYLKEKLPDYMVPTVFVPLDALPLTPNGKVDRRALPAPDVSRSNQPGVVVAPRNLLELQLVQIWEKLLDTRPIGVTDNFFELGGHSLLAVRLMAQIQRQFGQRLALASLFQEGATIEQLAGLLHTPAVATSRSPLVGIQPGGSKRPFFCVHPVGGNVLCYVNLARHLEPDQPFYGLQHPGLYGEGEPFTRIEAMATHYITAIRTLQPEGPYLLGGWSLGAMIAFEMARQLKSQDQEIAVLALFDPPQAMIPAQTQANGTAPLSQFVRDFGLALDEATFGSDHFRQLEPDQQLSYILAQAKTANLVSADVDLDQLRRYLQIFMANQQARRTYTPQTYPGRVTLLKAAERPASEEPTLGWGKFTARGVDAYTIPGDHYTLLKEPHVQILAEYLKRHLP
jgi:amino acid adenylation domain-containing protein